jgi:putative membrane protein
VRFHFQQAVRAFILLAFSVLLFKLHFTGEITKFINPKYEGLSQSASVLFLILFIIQTTRIWTVKENSPHHHCQHDTHDHHCSHDHGDSRFNTKKLIAYLVIVFPLVTGFLLPAKVLDASIADKKGGLAVLSNQKKAEKKQEEEAVPNNNQQEDPVINEDLVDLSRIKDKAYTNEQYEQLLQQLEQSSTIEMNDNVFSTYYEEMHMDLEKFKGIEITLKGFVYKEEGLEKDQLVLARFLITHCVADAGIIGFITELPEASSVEVNTWIEAKGVLDTTNYNGTKFPIIKITNWKVIDEPKEPYLYPISVKVL